MAAPIALTRIAQIAITITDIDRAVTFYTEALGLPLLFRAPPALAFFDCGGTRLMLSGPDGDLRPGGGTVLYFMVSDITAAHAQLVDRGVVFITEPRMIVRMPDHELWLAGFKDPDGNLLQLMAEVRG